MDMLQKKKYCEISNALAFFTQRILTQKYVYTFNVMHKWLISFDIRNMRMFLDEDVDWI